MSATSEHLRSTIARLQAENNLLAAENQAITTHRDQLQGQVADSLSLFLQATQDAMWDYNPATGALRWNESCGRMLGKDPSQIPETWEWWEERIHPADRERVTTSFRNAHLSSKNHWTCEYLFLNGDNDYIHVRDKALVIRNEHGETVRILGTMSDITESRRTEERLTTAISAATIALWDTDLITGKVWYAAEWQEMLGYPPEEIGDTNDTINHWIHPDQKDYMWEQVRLHIEEGVPLDFECQLLHKDGAYRWVRCCGRAFFDSQGKPVRLSGASRDITDRKENEVALRESRLQFDQMTESINEVIWMREPKTLRVLFVSSATERLFGLPPAHFYEDPYFVMKLTHPEDQHRIKSAFLDFEKTGYFDLEFRMVLPTGDTRWVHSRAYPLRDENGEIVRITGITADVTEQHRLRKSLEIASEVEKVTMGNDIHDTLCQELPSVKLQISALAKRFAKTDEESSKLLRELSDQIGKSAKTARQLAKGFSPLLADQENLRGALMQMLESEGPRFPQVRCTFEPKCSTEKLDNFSATQLYFIAREAVLNALRHGNPKRVCIMFWEEECTFCVSVVDDGSGRAEDLSHGTGLGIGSMYYRTSLLNGTLSILNNPDSGLQVICRVPLLKPNLQP